MKTSITPHYQTTVWGQEVNDILRTCVHCGFCTAVCSTYQLLGNELDSPRGRIYLIKAALEGHAVGHETQQHLDLCLTCRACETTCPSGVQYGHLIDIGRHVVESKVQRPLQQRWLRWSLRQLLPYPRRFRLLLPFARLISFLLPKNVRNHLVARSVSYKSKKLTDLTAIQVTHPRTVLMATGCVQSVLAPQINQAASKVLNQLGISVLPVNGCCGALDYHLSAHDAALKLVKKNIDVWWQLAQQTHAEALITTASGCGVFIKEYHYLLQQDGEYAEKAAKIATLTRDLSEIFTDEFLSQLKLVQPLPTIAVHVPCTLQHGQKLAGRLETLLTRLGFSLTTVPESHLCCGSAGTYSFTASATISQQLLQQKLIHLQSGQPKYIVTANIGCLNHLQTEAIVPVKHWIELVAKYLTS